MIFNSRDWTPKERIEAGSIPEPNSGCWIWLESTNPTGYAHLRYKTKLHRANRFSWSAYNGQPIPKGLFVLHTCDNRLCVNPDHLFLGTNQDNMDDMRAKGRHINSVPRGTTHRCAKLTEDDVREIRASNKQHRELAKQYGVSHANIGGIKRRTLWKHLP
jgi:hypothetical protein